MFKPTSETIYTADDLKDEHDLTPRQWATFLIICGKSGNNMKGVEGVGPTYATKYIQGKEVPERILKAIEAADLELMTHLTILPIHYAVPKLQRAEKSYENFKQFCIDHKFTSILREIKLWRKQFSL